MRRIFFDSYAIVAVSRGDHAYAPYARLPIHTHDFNILEFITAFLRDHPATHPSVVLDELRPNRILHTLEDLLEAALYKLRRSRDGVSYADSLGYVLALRHDMTFLTGDLKFRDQPNVDWVRAGESSRAGAA